METTHGWDARNQYANEVVYRLHLFLDASKENPKDYFEKLTDWYFLVCGAFKQPERAKFKQRLMDIEQLLFARVVDGKGLSDIERKKNYNIAVKINGHVLNFFEEAHTLAYKRGVYLPIRQVYAPGDAMKEMNV